MEIRRSGNFGIIDTGTDKGLISFSIGGRGKGWEPSSIQLNRRGAFFSRKISVNGTFIVPMGDNNDMPGEVMRLLDKFYAGEGIMGKIAGLQWGEGPRLYEDAIDEDNNRFYRRWKLDPEITADLEPWDYTHAGLFYKVCPEPCAACGQSRAFGTAGTYSLSEGPPGISPRRRG